VNLDIIKRFEGFEGWSYDDGVGFETIGYGTRLPITEVEAELLLRHRLVTLYLPAILESVKVSLTDNQMSALASFVYNVGVAAFKKSTLLKKLNAGDYGAVPAQLRRWNRAGGRVLQGLVRRREAEAELWSRE
jgi:lysozyme